MRRLIRNLLCLGLMVAPSGCASREVRPMLELRQLESLAVQFAQALYAKQLDQVLAQSDYPFYLNHRAVLDSAIEWRQVLESLFQHGQATEVKVLEIQPMSLPYLETSQPDAVAKLIEYGFADKQLMKLTLQTVSSQGQTSQEQVLLILSPISGKIVGFIQ